MTGLKIDYYIDALCVWAWISQRRLQELTDEWGEKVEVRIHFLNIFGDVESKINDKWIDKGGYEGFGNHVIESSVPYENAPVNSDVWMTVRPKTSSNAHLVLKAVALIYPNDLVLKFAFQVQTSFFKDLMDIGDMNILFDLALKEGFDIERIKQKMNDGSAMAALMHDYQMAKELNIKGSPTWIMNNGRQQLFGNVGYRILSANIKEILDKPQQQASWC